MQRRMTRLTSFLIAALLLIMPLAAVSAQGEGDITLVPFNNDNFSTSGLVPEGWAQVAAGVYARQASADDPTSLIQQAAAGGNAEELGTLLAGQLGLASLPDNPETIETDAFTWTVYQVDLDLGELSLALDIALADADNTAHVVLLQTTPDDYEALHEAVFLPALDAYSVVVPEPLPYAAEDITFENTSAEEPVTLAGTLTLPEGDGPFPAVILISGSGAQDRDESLGAIAAIKPFALIADYLTREGIAVLRYDDRGVGGSGGGAASDTSALYATDTEAALDYLLTRDEIDAEAIGLLGHSEGGYIAPMVANERDEVAFVIALGGSAVPGVDVLVRQNERLMEVEGASEEEIAAQVTFVEELAVLIAEQDWEAAETLLAERTADQIRALPEEQISGIDDIDAYAAQLAAQQMPNFQGWYEFFLSYDPAEAWSQLSVPVLAFYGELDTQVDSEQNAPVLEAALEEAGNEDVTIIVYPTANHLFQDAVTGGTDEYGTLEQTFVPDLLPTITDWILERFGA